MSTGKRIGYVRVSTIDQNPERQLEGITLDKKFTEFASGKTLQRPQLDLMLEYVRDDDNIFVHSMDRLGRSVKDLKNIIDDLTKRGITIHFVKENLIFSSVKSPMNDFMLHLLGAVAELELSRIRERQLEGIALAKKMGKYKGRKRSLNDEKMEILKQEMMTRKTKSKIAKELGISRFTLYKYLKEIQNNEMQTAV